MVLLASWLICLTTAKPSSSYPALESFDAIDADNYYIPYAEPITDFRLSRLRRGYYYVDNGFITAVPGSALPGGRRRLDSEAAKSAEERQDSYTPLLRYRQQRTKRKKLFVPNLYG